MRIVRWCWLLILPLAPLQAAQPQVQLNQTLESLAASKETEAQLKQKLEQTQADLEALQQRATALAERLQTSEEKVIGLELSVNEINTKLVAKQKDFDARKADYATTIVTLIRLGELPSSALFSSPSDIQDLIRATSMLEVTNRTVAAKAKLLRDDVAQLKALKTESAKRTGNTLREKKLLAEAQETLAQAIVSRKKLQARLATDHDRAAEKVTRLSRQSQSLQELISKLEENNRIQASKRPASNKSEPSKNTSISSRGSLRSPVVGTLIHHFGERKNANETYRGLVFRARKGATVVAPLDGEIVFTGPFRDYGNMVLIKHASGYISLVAGLAEVTAGLNQKAIRGEPIGVAAADSSSDVYVELRDPDAKPIDPANWFAKVIPKSAP
jgi:septal ring factor EnvC (AmiA/AmiB activator)